MFNKFWNSLISYYDGKTYKPKFHTINNMSLCVIYFNIQYKTKLNAPFSFLFLFQQVRQFYEGSRRGRGMRSSTTTDIRNLEENGVQLQEWEERQNCKESHYYL